MLTTQTADSVLKSYYLNAMTEQLNSNINPLLARIQQTTSDVSGKDVRKLVHVGLSGGIGAGSETGDLPAVGESSYVQFVSTLKNLYGTIEISDKAIRAAQNSENAFIDLLNTEMETLVKSAQFNFGRMLFGDGTGRVCKFTGTGPVYTADNVNGLAEGMIIDVNTTSQEMFRGKKITAIDRDTKKVTVPGTTAAIPSGDFANVYVQGSRDSEICGLAALFGQGTLYGVARVNNPWMKPYSKTNVGAITEAEVQKAIDTVEVRTGSRIDFIVTSPGVRRALANVLSAYRQMETMELEGGYRAISFNGIPVVADKFCPEGTMYLLNTKEFALHQLCDWQWLEGEDGKILKQVPGKPVYTATLVKYAELMCYLPAGQAMLSGITEA